MMAGPDKSVCFAADLEEHSIKEETLKYDDECLKEGSFEHADNVSNSISQDYDSPIELLKTEKIEVSSEESIFESIPDVTFLIPEFQTRITHFLPPHWICICDSFGVSNLLLSRDVERTTQRRVFVSYLGDVSVSVHRKRISDDIVRKVLSGIQIVPLLQNNVGNFVTFVIAVVDAIRKLEVCVGCTYEEYSSCWTVSALCNVDFNPYGETRYSKTFRSLNCQLLVISSKWRCKKCYYLKEILKRKLKSHTSVVKVHTPSIHLNEAEKNMKLSHLQKKLEVSRKLVSRWKNKVELMKKEVVTTTSNNIP